MRKIKVTDDTFSNMREIQSSAETLLELKNELRSNGIHFGDKEFIEGRSRTKLTDDDSQLPKTVKFRGEETDELTIILLTPDKKVASGGVGSYRKTLFENIKQLKLEDTVKATFGKDYTRVKTEQLEDFMTAFTSKKGIPVKEECIDEPVVEPEETKEEEVSMKEQFNSLVGCLYEKGYLTGEEIQEIFLGKKVTVRQDDELEELKRIYGK